MDVQVLGISVDSAPANAAFAEKLRLTFPLLSDWHRRVSRAYGILDEERGFARRATFVLDKNGVIRHVEQGRAALEIAGAKDVCRKIGS